MSYTHITEDDRVELGALLRAKTKKQDIATLLGKHRSSIWRERKRNMFLNSSTHYHARVARIQTTVRRLAANQRFRKIEQDHRLRRYIHRKLKRTWTPEQIAGALEDKHKRTIVCQQTIYTYIYETKPQWVQYLRRKKDSTRRKHGTIQRAKHRELGKKKWIEQRPSVVETRSRIGDWEGDTVWGKERNLKILTYVERRSGLLRASLLKLNTANEVRLKTKKIFSKFKRNNRQTVTYDNGLEFSDYEWIEKDTGLQTYFANPYHSWERGTNENTNGLLRQFFPKGSSFATVTQKQVDRAVWMINTRPRKRHHYKTPIEVFKLG
jgi:IS30 family transposase